MGRKNPGKELKYSQFWPFLVLLGKVGDYNFVPIWIFLTWKRCLLRLGRIGGLTE